MPVSFGADSSLDESATPVTGIDGVRINQGVIHKYNTQTPFRAVKKRASQVGFINMKNLCKMKMVKQRRYRMIEAATNSERETFNDETKQESGYETIA